LKQPITASVLNAGSALLWLKHNPPNIREAKETTNKIIESGKLAGEIIDRLRSLYTKALPKREPLALNEVIGEMIEMLRGEAMRYGVSVRANLANNLPSASADRMQIQQVLMNRSC
jgi:C4-dicarboxylate-specific signal transduction histidine kinase